MEQGQIDQERRNLEIEYKQLCEDWRTRDRYVLEKLLAAGILFTLLGYAITSTQGNEYLLRLLLACIGVLMSYTLVISVFKDIYYRDGTEKLLICLSEYMGMKDSLQTLKQQKKFPGDLHFPRKTKVGLKSTSLKSLKVPRILKRFLKNRTTFNWIFYFYFTCFFIFLIFMAKIVYDWVCEALGLCLVF